MEGEQCLWLIQCRDDPELPVLKSQDAPCLANHLRIQFTQEHRAWQKATSTVGNPNHIKKIAAGPCFDDTATTAIGSAFIVEGTREAAYAFNRNDPFFMNGVWKDVTITRYLAPHGIQSVAPLH